MKPAQNMAYVELHVPDFQKITAYYGRLGFQVMRETPPKGKNGYLVLKMEANLLCFWAGNEQVYEQSYFKQFPSNTKRGYGVEIVIMVTDVEQYYEKVKDFANVVEPLAMRAWGLKDFRVEDPFGYYLRITSIHNVIDRSETSA
jgi:uncharacterized glyoxalase superfamily protein PhnB